MVVDEAHNMAAYRRPNGAVDKRQAYILGEILSRRMTYFSADDSDAPQG